jgi:phage/conjugal plasmid C-4 type zinc finger TraR family protein
MAGSHIIKVMTMATGWAGDGAVQDQIDATVKDAISRVKARLPTGPSLANCAQCEAEIPEARRIAIPGVRLCLTCQAEQDREAAKFTGYNRRGSKDSQLR